MSCDGCGKCLTICKHEPSTAYIPYLEGVACKLIDFNKQIENLNEIGGGLKTSFIICCEII